MSGAGDPVKASNALIDQGRALEALRLIEPYGKLPGADLSVLSAYALALKANGRLEDTLQAYSRGLKAEPHSPIAEHKVGAALGDLGRHKEAEAALRRAIAKGGQAPATFAVLGRQLMHLQRFDEALAAYRESIRRDPSDAEVQRDLAQLIWMRSKDPQAATEHLRAAVAADPGHVRLAVQLAKALQYSGDEAGAYEALNAAARRQAGIDFDLEVAAANLSTVRKQSKATLFHAERALAVRPGDTNAGILALDGYLGLGMLDTAAELARLLHQRQPNEQQILARLATAWRLQGDPRYRQLYDYERVVKAHVIDTPPGWKVCRPTWATWPPPCAASTASRPTPSTSRCATAARRPRTSSCPGIRRSRPSSRPSTGRSAGTWSGWGRGATRCAAATPAITTSPASGRCCCGPTASTSTTSIRRDGCPRPATSICPRRWTGKGATRAGSSSASRGCRPAQRWSPSIS
jgi:Tfp pilus assembly protein PilF